MFVINACIKWLKLAGASNWNYVSETQRNFYEGKTMIPETPKDEIPVDMDEESKKQEEDSEEDEDGEKEPDSSIEDV